MDESLSHHHSSAPPVLVVLDVDSTLINEEAVELLADQAGSGQQVAAITESAMRGEIDFAQSLIERVKTLKNLPTSVFNDVGRLITLTKGAEALVEHVHRIGGLVGVVSGGFHELIDPLALRLKLDYWLANRLDTHDGLLTGNLVGEIIDASAKEEALVKWAHENRVPLANTVVVGDGANDLRMMARAGLSVAFDAKPKVRQQADICINRRDLGLVLGLIGIEPSR